MTRRAQRNILQLKNNAFDFFGAHRAVGGENTRSFFVRSAFSVVN